jgi:hypothetical protein
MTARAEFEMINNFLWANDLDLSGKGSDLNSVCTIIAGFMLYMNIQHFSEVVELMRSGIDMEDSESFEQEMIRVYNYAKKKNYGSWWETKKAKSQYNF